MFYQNSLHLSDTIYVIFSIGTYTLTFTEIIQKAVTRSLHK